jgi:uncharacterized membrane protein
MSRADPNTRSGWSDRDVERRRGRTPPKFLPSLAAILLILTVTAFLRATPGGLLRKADMVGYAVCHQIESHSFSLAGRQLPLYARCTGTFLGALGGLISQAFLLRRRRAAAFPTSPILFILLSFTLTWIVDGANSYLALIGGANLYEPSNTLRLVTGTLNGLTMSAFVYPVFNVSLWQAPVDKPALQGARDLGVLLLMASLLVILILSDLDFLLYPVAFLSAAGVLALLTGVNSVIAVVLLRRENAAGSWRQALVPVAIGLVMSFIQIGVIDLIRYRLTGTLHGIPSLQ